MTTASFRPAPGVWQTRIVVWELDDTTKTGDARYWWSAAEVGRLRRVVAPEFADRLSIAGTPKGRSLAAIRSGGHPITQMAEPLRLSLAPRRGADPEKTYLIISHVLGPIGRG